MVNIIPFNGYRFNPEKVSGLGNVMAPPYDAISASEQEDLYKRDKYNIVRLNKGAHLPTDNDSDNPYSRAEKLLGDWIKADILVRDSEPCFYLYEQQVVYKNTTYTNLGLVGLLELQDLNSNNILQCEKANEKTLSARSELLRYTKSNFSMINCIYMEYEKAIMNKLNDIAEKNEPVMDFITKETVIGEGVTQKLWRISDKKTIDFIRNILKNHTFYIADGQTRYEVSLAYKKECEKNNPIHTGKEPYNYIMTLFTNAYDDGLIQLPVHRLIKFPKKVSEDFFVACAQDYFKVEKIIIDTANDGFLDTMKKQIATRNENKFALYFGENYFYRLTLKNMKRLKELLPNSSDAYRLLDANVIRYLILKELLNMSDEQITEYVSYTPRSSVGIKAVQNGEFNCMIAVNPVKADQICNVATAHERMPERSMFIFPKASTGAVIYKMGD